MSESRVYGAAPGGGKSYRWHLVATETDDETKALFANAAKQDGAKVHHEIRHVTTPDGVVTIFATVKCMSDAYRFAGLRLRHVDISRLTNERAAQYLQSLVRWL